MILDSCGVLFVCLVVFFPTESIFLTGLSQDSSHSRAFFLLSSSIPSFLSHGGVKVWEQRWDLGFCLRVRTAAAAAAAAAAATGTVLVLCLAHFYSILLACSHRQTALHLWTPLMDCRAAIVPPENINSFISILSDSKLWNIGGLSKQWPPE